MAGSKVSSALNKRQSFVFVLDAPFCLEKLGF